MQDSMFVWMILAPVLMFSFILAIGLIVKVQEKFYLTALGLLLLAYAVTGKGLAYLGIAPLYVSEMVLALGIFSFLLITLFRGRLYIGAVTHWSALFLFLLMIWGAIRTVPYLSEYGMDALRDGSMWGYGIFAFLMAFLLTQEGLRRFFNQYSRLLPWILLALLLGYYLRRSIELPILPNSPVAIIYLKAGDAGVHLAGIGAFLLLGLDRFYGKRYAQWQLWLIWAMWGGAWLIYGATSRGGMVAALVGLVIAFVLRPKLQGWVRPAMLLIVILMLLFFADASGISQVGSDNRRELSFNQISTNFTSMLGGESRSDQTATASWRFGWWEKIWGYTVDGEYRWMGKGFGINLAADDGYGSVPGQPVNRHPHNYTMSILAHAGLPGFILVLLFYISFGLRLLLATKREGYAGRTAVWLLAYWTAFLFNAQFDVFFENPMGGIWFWSLVGISWVFIYRVPKSQESTVPSTNLLALYDSPSQAG